MTLLLFVLMMSAGQVLFKRVGLAAAESSFVSAVLSWEMILAVAIYGAATLLWVQILSTTALSVAYPFAMLSVVVVAFAGIFLYGEPLSWKVIVGAGFVIGGALLISL